MNDVHLKKGSKVVQGIIREAVLPEMEEISNEMYEKCNNTERGEG
jgi:dUTPase